MTKQDVIDFLISLPVKDRIKFAGQIAQAVGKDADRFSSGHTDDTTHYGLILDETDHDAIQAERNAGKDMGAHSIKSE